MTGPWEKFGAAGPWQKYGPQAQGRSDAAATAFGQGATFNFGDELTAAVRATAPGLSDWMMSGPSLQRDESIGGSPTAQTTSKAGSWKERYEEELAKTRGQMKADAEAYPNMTTAANIAGNVATSALALPAAATSVAPTLLGNVAKVGATGAALGGAQGFGEGEGLEDRVAKATTGAMFGGATGAAIPVAGVVGRAALESRPGRFVSEKMVSPLVRLIASKLEGVPMRSLSAAAPDGTPGVMGPLTQFADDAGNVAQRGAVDRLATAAQRARMDPRAVSSRLDTLGPEAMFADVDPQFLSAARMANTMPGQTRSHAKAVLEGRDRQAGNRLTRVFEGSEPAPSAYALRGEEQAFDQFARAVGQQAYQGDMVASGLKQSPEMRAMLDNPAVAAAIKKVTGEIAEARKMRSNSMNPSPVEVMHMVKREIARLGEEATGRGTSTQPVWRDLADDFVNTLKRDNPALAEADKVYRHAKSLPDFFDAGASLLRREATTGPALETSAPALAEKLGGATAQQTLAARTGATNVARSQAQEGTDSARALAKRIDTSTPVRDKIVQLYGPEWGNRIMGQAGAERQFAETSNEILRGSKTADKIAEILDTGNTAVRIGAGGVTGRVLEKVDDLVNKIAGPNEAVRDAIGRIALNPNNEENRRVLALIADVLQRRAAGRPLAAGAAGATGGGFAGDNP